MGLHFARARRTAGNEPSASITWQEYVAALSAAIDPSDGGRGGHAAGGPGTPGLPWSLLTHPACDAAGSAPGPLEAALRLVRRRARRAVGLVDALQLQCEAATLRLLLIQLHARLGNVDRAHALARETQAVL